MNYFTHARPRLAVPLILALLLALASTPAAASELDAPLPIPAESSAPAYSDLVLVEPAPLPEEAPAPLPSDVPTLITATAIRWNLPADRLLRIAWCESRWDPTAISYAGHLGLFQFAHPTWRVASHAVGLPDASPFDPAANTEAAAWLMSTDGFHHWGCR